MDNHFPITILRWGLAFVFFCTALTNLLRPSPLSLGTVFSVYEIVLAVWLFWGRKLVWAAAFSVLTLAGIVVFHAILFSAVFSDIGLLFAGLALFSLARHEKEKIF